MKKVFFGVMVIFTVVCFLGLMPSAAADKPKVVFGEGTEGIDTETPAREVHRGTESSGGPSYIKENYTTTAPPSGENYNTRAESVFSYGETIYLVDRYYMSATGSYTRYYFIKDVVGYTVAFSGKSFTLTSSGDKYGTKTFDSSTLGYGSYMYQSVTLGPGGPIISNQFPFTVK
ncbi:MAG: hypothetical protein R6U38_10700 [Desulfatiglandaceae bacterium]